MKYVIMADGDMKRWNMACKIPKHMVKIGNETLLERLVRQVHTLQPEAQAIITSHDRRYEVAGAIRYEPKNNRMEIDRFTWELIEDDTCFLYGDTYYTDEAIRVICQTQTDRLHFVGTDRSIVALIAHREEELRRHITRVKEAFLAGECHDCRGWQVYQSYTGQPFDRLCIGKDFTKVPNDTCGFNEWQEYQYFLEKRNAAHGHI